MGSGNWIVDNLNSALNMWTADWQRYGSCSPAARRIFGAAVCGR